MDNFFVTNLVNIAREGVYLAREVFEYECRYAGWSREDIALDNEGVEFNTRQISMTILELGFGYDELGKNAEWLREQLFGKPKQYA